MTLPLTWLEAMAKPPLQHVRFTTAVHQLNRRPTCSG
jgi:hypothetical protein